MKDEHGRLKQENDRMQYSLDRSKECYNDLMRKCTRERGDKVFYRDQNRRLKEKNRFCEEENDNLKEKNKRLEEKGNGRLKEENSRLKEEILALQEQLRGTNLSTNNLSENGSGGKSCAAKLAEAYNTLADSKAAAITSAVSVYNEMTDIAEKCGYQNMLPTAEVWNEFVEQALRAQRTLNVCSTRIKDCRTWLSARREAKDLPRSQKLASKMAEVRREIQDLLRGTS